MACDISRLDELEEPEEILDFLKELDAETTQRYHALHNEWEKNLLFYLGKQWLVKKSGTYDGYDILAEEDGHYRPVTNHVARACDLKRSQVLGKIVRTKVEPNSTSREDIASARMGSLLLRALAEMDDEDSLNQLAFLHAQVFGICWRADYKQAVLGEEIEEALSQEVEQEYRVCESCGYEVEEEELPTEGPGAGGTGAPEASPTVCPECAMPTIKRSRMMTMPVMGDDGQQQVRKIPTYKNVVAIIDPFRMKTNPCAVEKDLRYLQESSILPVEWIKRAFDIEDDGFLGHEAVEKVKKAPGLPRGLKISEEFKSSTSFSHSSLRKEVTSGNMVENNEDTTILHKHYFHPSARNPKGRLIIWTPDTLLYDGKPDVPQKGKLKKWHPYNYFVYRRHPLRLEGIPYIEDLIPLNKAYNSITSMIMEHLDKTADPDRVEFNNVTKNNDDQASGVIIVEPMPNLPGGGIPTYLQHPQMASEVYNMLPMKVAELEKIGNVTEVMQGIRPAGVDTYRGLELLRDTANSSEKELYARFHSLIRKSSQLKLAIVQECLVSQNTELLDMMNIVRKNENYGMEEVKQFMGEDLRDNLNVVIEEVDYMSQSTGAQTDRVADLLKSMILTPEDLQDPVVKIQLMRRLGMAQMPMSDKADIEKAERIIEYLEAGNIQQAMKILSIRDNKSLQLRVWSEWMKTSRYESLPPNIQMMSEQLVKRVEMELIQAQQAMQPAGMGPPPGPGGTGPQGGDNQIPPA